MNATTRTPTRALLVGATGNLGPHLTTALKQHFDDVTVTVRDPRHAKEFEKQGIHVITEVDITDDSSKLEQALAQLPHAPDSVIMAAGTLKARSPLGFKHTNADGPSRVMKALSSAGKMPRTWLQVSSALADPRVGKSDYAISKRQGEAAARAEWERLTHGAKGFVAVRPGGIIDPVHDEVTLDPIAKALQGFLGIGFYPNVTTGDNPVIGIISAKDTAESLAIVAKENAEHPSSGSFELSNGENLSHDAIVRSGEMVFGHPVLSGTRWGLKFPWFLSVAAFVSECQRALFGTATVMDRTRVAELTNPNLGVDNKNILEAFPALKKIPLQKFEQILLQWDMAKQMAKNGPFNRLRHGIAKWLGLVT